jgi:hypothetical protein
LEIETSIAGNDLNNIWPKDDVEDGCKAEEPTVCRASNRQRKVPSNKSKCIRTSGQHIRKLYILCRNTNNPIFYAYYKKL